MTRCFFPLRTSVEWFDNPESPAIEGRIKQAAVLYDELLFEDGMVEIDITDHGAIHGWRPADDGRGGRSGVTVAVDGFAGFGIEIEAL
jgi:hypothetical protein